MFVALSEECVSFKHLMTSILFVEKDFPLVARWKVSYTGKAIRANYSVMADTLLAFVVSV